MVVVLIAMVIVMIVVPGHGQSAALFCVRDRYRMAETEVSVPLAFTGISNGMRMASAGLIGQCQDHKGTKLIVF